MGRSSKKAGYPYFRGARFAYLDDSQNTRTSAVIECEGKKGVTISFTCTLIIEGEIIPSLNSILRSADLVVNNVGKNAPSRVGITDFRHFLEEGEDKLVTVYQIYVEPTLGFARMAEVSSQEKTETSNKLVIVERRFSEFVILDTTMRVLAGEVVITGLGDPLASKGV